MICNHSVKHRLIRSLLVALIWILPLVQTSLAQDETSFRFVFMTDIHVQDENIGGPGFSKAIEKINELNPEFVLTGGDIVMDALGQNYDEALKQFNLYNEIEKDFAMPVYHTMGNHENYGVYTSSGISTDHPQYGKRMYKEMMGLDETYYSFDHKNWHFIVLDDIGYTSERRYYGRVDSLQIEWLKSDLAEVDNETPIAVAVHIPFVSVIHQIMKGGTTSVASSLLAENSNEVLALFEDYNLRLILQGHLHIVEESVVGNIHFITGGAVCGDKWKGPKYIFPEGFVVVDVDGDNFDWHYQTYGWKAN